MTITYPTGPAAMFHAAATQATQRPDKILTWCGGCTGSREWHSRQPDGSYRCDNCGREYRPQKGN